MEPDSRVFTRYLDQIARAPNNARLYRRIDPRPQDTHISIVNFLTLYGYNDAWHLRVVCDHTNYKIRRKHRHGKPPICIGISRLKCMNLSERRKQQTGEWFLRQYKRLTMYTGIPRQGYILSDIATSKRHTQWYRAHIFFSRQLAEFARHMIQTSSKT